MKIITSYIEKLILSITILSVVLLTIIISLNILLRYFFNSPILWADEFALYMLVWTTFLGSTLALKHNQLPAVTILLDRLHTKKRRVLYIFIQIAIFTFSLILMMYALEWVTSANVLFRVSAAMRIPMWIPYVIFPITMFLNLIFVVQNVADEVKGE